KEIHNLRIFFGNFFHVAGSHEVFIQGQHTGDLNHKSTHENGRGQSFKIIRLDGGNVGAADAGLFAHLIQIDVFIQADFTNESAVIVFTVGNFFFHVVFHFIDAQATAFETIR